MPEYSCAEMRDAADVMQGWEGLLPFLLELACGLLIISKCVRSHWKELQITLMALLLILVSYSCSLFSAFTIRFTKSRFKAFSTCSSCFIVGKLSQLCSSLHIPLHPLQQSDRGGWHQGETHSFKPSEALWEHPCAVTHLQGEEWTLSLRAQR